MGKIVLLVPREEMLYLAHNILQEKKYAIAQMRVIQTENTVVEARNSIAAGADIIIARGLQASLIKQYTVCACGGNRGHGPGDGSPGGKGQADS